MTEDNTRATQMEAQTIPIPVLSSRVARVTEKRLMAWSSSCASSNRAGVSGTGIGADSHTPWFSRSGSRPV